MKTFLKLSLLGLIAGNGYSQTCESICENTNSKTCVSHCEDLNYPYLKGVIALNARAVTIPGFDSEMAVQDRLEDARAALRLKVKPECKKRTYAPNLHYHGGERIGAYFIEESVIQGWGPMTAHDVYGFFKCRIY